MFFMKRLFTDRRQIWVSDSFLEEKAWHVLIGLYGYLIGWRRTGQQNLIREIELLRGENGDRGNYVREQDCQPHPVNVD